MFKGDQSLAAQTPLPTQLFTEFEDTAHWSYTYGSRDFDMYSPSSSPPFLFFTLSHAIFFRDHGLMIENLLDPAHLPFTHDGTISRRENAEEISFSVVYDNIFDKSNSTDV